MLVHNQLEDIIKDTTSFTRTTKKTKKEQGMRKMSMKETLKFYCGRKSIENTFYISAFKKNTRKYKEEYKDSNPAYVNL